MSRNSSGTYTLPNNSWNPAVTSTTISPSDWNATASDLVSAMTDSLSRSGKGGMQADLDMGTHNITNGVFQGTAIGVAYGGTGATTAAGARAYTNLNVERWTAGPNGAYQILNTDRTVAVTNAFTAPRTYSLPLANTCNPGQKFTVLDAIGTVGSVNTLTIQRTAPDTINNGTTPAVLNNPNTGIDFITDGVSAWTYAGVGQAITNSNLAFMSNLTIKSNISGGTTNPADNSLSSILDACLSSTRGSVIARSSSGWAAIGPGTAGFVLTMNGTGLDPVWATNGGGGGGAVTSFNSRTGAVIPTAGDYTGDMINSPAITPTQINANQNNYNPTNLATSQFVRISSDIARTITGMATVADGRTVYLFNAGSFTITLSNENASSTAANRFMLGADTPILAGTGLALIYDNANTRWVPRSGNMLGSENLAEISNAVIARKNLGILIPPQGRLTLTSGTPVMATSVAAATAVYYAPYQGCFVPISDGTNVSLYAFTSSATDTVGLTLTLGANWVTNSNYDLFIVNDGGTIRLGTGPAWTSDTARGTGAGTTELQLFNGLWTNKNTMTLRYANTSTLSAAVNTATYVGTMRTGSAGQTNYIFGASAAGGTAASFGLYNAYNQVDVATTVTDSNGSWSTSSVSVANMDVGGTGLGANNRISFILGMAQDPLTVEIGAQILGSAGFGVIGFQLDGNSSMDKHAVGALPGGASSYNYSVATGFNYTYSGSPSLSIGWHFIQALQQANGVDTATFGGGVAYHFDARMRM